MATERSLGTRALLLASRLGARLFNTFDETMEISGGEYASSSEEEEDEEDERPHRSSSRAPEAETHPPEQKKSCPQPMQNELAQEINMATSANDQTLKLTGSKRGRTVHTVSMLAAREINASGNGKFSRAEACHMAARYLPCHGPESLVQKNSRVYISQFSNDGSLFVAGSQDRTIIIYDVNSNCSRSGHGPVRSWPIRKSVTARNLKWTITDTALSPDQRFLVYASITPVVHLVNLGNETGGIESLANVTDIHEGLAFGLEDADSGRGFGIWSLKFSHDGNELVAGSNDNSIYVYDLNAAETTFRVSAHRDEVNAVAFADESGHLIFSGSDDCLCKVWDRRCFGGASKPAGKLVGHLGGITFIDSRGDGRHFISNSKDQTVKLWDIRVMSSGTRHTNHYIPRWDYRYMRVPPRLRHAKHPGDQSLMSYRGHEVLQTLIRCYFSPTFSTGQKYIYTGSYNGPIYIYDLVTGAVAARLEYHTRTVRDCSWHPWQPMLVSSCWGGSIAKWSHAAEDEDGPRRRVDAPGYFADAYYDSDE